MGLSPDSNLSDLIGEIKRKLNPDGRGYKVAAAADALVDAVRVGCGFLTANMRELARAGATVKIRDHNMTSAGKPPRGKAKELAEAVSAIGDGQGDFADYADDFSWMDDETSLDDTLDAIRKAYRDLNLAEAKQVVGLKHKKAAETEAAANRLQRTIDEHPEWAKYPNLTLGVIAGID
jgi:hypothetical protein